VKSRIYIDTSIVGGYFDSMFAEATIAFFNAVLETKSVLVISELLLAEISMAPQNVRDFFNTMPKELLEFVKTSDDAEHLANLYINEKVVGASSRADCLHIATATTHHVSVLASWNFKHIVNLTRIKGYNSINLREGYASLEIRTPKEIFNND
jgi:hypothetical protein